MSAKNFSKLIYWICIKISQFITTYSASSIQHQVQQKQYKIHRNNNFNINSHLSYTFCNTNWNDFIYALYILSSDAIKLANLNDNLRRPLQKLHLIHTLRDIYLYWHVKHFSRFKIEPSSYFYSICHITSSLYPSNLIYHVPIFIRQVYNTQANVFRYTLYWKMCNTPVFNLHVHHRSGVYVLLVTVL